MGERFDIAFIFIIDRPLISGSDVFNLNCYLIQGLSLHGSGKPLLSFRQEFGELTTVCFSDFCPDPGFQFGLCVLPNHFVHTVTPCGVLGRQGFIDQCR